MSLEAGRHIGPYQVQAAIGSGGMGEVYRATDTNLKRSVAIKVLPAALATDPDRLARFQREAEVLATLNHPNIAGIYGLERVDGATALVMELVEGPTLADRIAEGRIPLDEALPIAKQIAEAVEAAHEQSIVHRDLKPANVKLRQDGTVKVLDFGLAKAFETTAAGAAVNLSISPTITTPAMTQAGVILGTAAYMSPEQAKGRVVDRRTDVWAFGCILFEMLTARRAFEGEDVTDTIAAVVRGEPDWSALPSETPPQIRLLLKRCLEKERRIRIADLSVARFLMTETLGLPTSETPSGAPPPKSRPSRRIVAATALVALLSGALATVAILWSRGMFDTPPARPPIRFAITPSAAYPVMNGGNDHEIAIAPDGSRIVYRSAATAQQTYLVVRDLNSLDERPLPVPGARNPFFSPDGQWIGFFARNELQRISISGGPPITICKVAGGPRGASWGDNDVIVFAMSGTGVAQVSARGGEPKTLTKPDVENAIAHVFPVVLPGSKAALFISRSGANVGAGRIEVLDLETGQHRGLLDGANDVAYSRTGHVVYAAPSNDTGARVSGSLRAVPFDVKQLTITGDSVPIRGEVAISASTLAAEYAISGRGDLIYIPDDPRAGGQVPRTLVWVDRKGKEEALQVPERAYGVARLSPDGSRIALDARDQSNDIWIWDVARKTLTPLNRDPGQDMSPLWTPDGRRIIWTSTRGGGNPNLYWQSADGTGRVERLTTAGNNQFPTSITPDGSTVVIFGGGAIGPTLFKVPLSGADRKAAPLVDAPFTYFGGEISPDGRWLAYASNESGEFQVYVRPYPKVDSGRFPISTSGGSRPAWARSGRELFYLDASGFLTSVSVTVKDDALAAGTPTKILATKYYAGSSILGLDLRAYDVAPDAQRFLMIKEATGQQPAVDIRPSIVVVADWAEELKTRVR